MVKDHLFFVGISFATVKSTQIYALLLIIEKKHTKSLEKHKQHYV